MLLMNISHLNSIELSVNKERICVLLAHIFPQKLQLIPRSLRNKKIASIYLTNAEKRR